MHTVSTGSYPSLIVMAMMHIGLLMIKQLIKLVIRRFFWKMLMAIGSITIGDPMRVKTHSAEMHISSSIQSHLLSTKMVTWIYGADAPAASHYDNALLFEGDFTKSIPVAQDLVQRESQHNGVEYRLFGDNCMQTSAAILSASLNAYDSFLLDLALIPTAPRLCRFYVWIFADDSIDLQKDE